MNFEEENFKYKYLKYKLKYFNLHGAGAASSSYKTEDPLKSSSYKTEDPLIQPFILSKCNYDTNFNSYRINEYLRSKPNFSFSDTYDKYYKFYSNFNEPSLEEYRRIINVSEGKSDPLKDEDKIGSGTYNIIYKYTLDGEELSAARARKIPTYNIDEINFLIELNKYKDNEGERCFSHFKYVLFDIYNLVYYISYEFYTNDLWKYCKYLLDTSRKGYSIDIDQVVDILKQIEKKLNKKFEVLLELDYICIDIKLDNILVKHSSDGSILEELVLHDHDFIGCCSINKHTNCKSDEIVKKHLLLYYKLNIFIWFFKIARRLNFNDYKLYKTEIAKTSLDDLIDFFQYILLNDITSRRGMRLKDACKAHIIKFDDIDLYYNSSNCPEIAKRIRKMALRHD